MTRKLLSATWQPGTSQDEVRSFCAARAWATSTPPVNRRCFRRRGSPHVVLRDEDEKASLLRRGPRLPANKKVTIRSDDFWMAGDPLRMAKFALAAMTNACPVAFTIWVAVRWTHSRRL